MIHARHHPFVVKGRARKPGLVEGHAVGGSGRCWKIKPSGFNRLLARAAPMLHRAKKLGLKARSVTVTWEQLTTASLPHVARQIKPGVLDNYAARSQRTLVGAAIGAPSSR